MRDMTRYGRAAPLTVTAARRPSGGIGRFGGGWNWKLGFQAGGHSLLLSLLVLEVKVVRR